MMLLAGHTALRVLHFPSHSFHLCVLCLLAPVTVSLRGCHEIDTCACRLGLTLTFRRQPIAVMVSEEERRTRVRNSVQATPSLPRSDQRLFRWLCRRGRRQMPVRETGEAVQVEQGAGERLQPVPRKDIQVVVAIAMPCRPRRISSLPMLETWRDQDVGMSYSIGVHAIPWNGEV